MSRSRDTYHHGDLAEALEAAAMRLLAERPASEISLREVARVADVSHNAPYHHFRDRVGLLKVLAEHSMAGLVAAVDDAVASAPDSRAALVDAGEAYIHFAADRVHAFDVIYDPSVCVPGQPTATMAPLIERLETVLADVGGAVGLDTAADGVALWGLMHGLGTLVGAGHLTLDDARTGYRAAVGRLVA